MSEQLYHEIACPTLTKTGPCNCTTQIVVTDAPLSKRLGFMADAMVSAVVGPKSRFFSRERVDEIVLLLREAEKALVNS